VPALALGVKASRIPQPQTLREKRGTARPVPADAVEVPADFAWSPDRRARWRLSSMRPPCHRGAVDRTALDTRRTDRPSDVKPNPRAWRFRSVPAPKSRSWLRPPRGRPSSGHTWMPRSVARTPTAPTSAICTMRSRSSR